MPNLYPWLFGGIIGLAALSQGCFTTALVNGNVQPGAEKHEEWNSFFFWGLAGEAEVDATEACRGRDVWKVEEGTNGATWVVSFFTLGIYSPRKVYITCAAPTRTAARPQ